ncbi:hypothetical protein ACTS93_15390 [Empedobacter falsenii]
MDKETLDPRKFFSVDENDVRSYRSTDGTFINLGLGIPINCVDLYTRGFPYLKLKKGAEILFEKLSEKEVLKLINTKSKNDVTILSKLITSTEGKAIVATRRKQLLKS